MGVLVIIGVVVVGVVVDVVFVAVDGVLLSL